MKKVKKVLNNNVLLVVETFGPDKILIGPGIGYGLKAGTFFTDNDKVQQVFVLSEAENRTNFDSLVRNIDPQIIAVVEEELQVIQNYLAEPLNEGVHVTLIDHVAGAIDRYKKGILFTNPFSDLMKFAYQEEYDLTSKMIDRINKTFSVQLNENENAILAMHINAARTNKSVMESTDLADMVYTTVQEFYAMKGIEIDRNSFAYQRLLIHCKFVFERILNHQPIKNELTSLIIGQYPEEYNKLKILLTGILEDYDVQVSDDEIAYLILHARRIME